MAHTEGFNRSPSDVTGARLVKYGVAPVIKQAFEEVYKAPFILKILLAELGHKREKDALLTVNYDGTFEDTAGCAVLAATLTVQQEMTAYLRRESGAGVPLPKAVVTALFAWALGDRIQRQATDEREDGGKRAEPSTVPDAQTLSAHLRDTMAERTLECAVLDRNEAGSSKYRALSPDELGRLLPGDLQTALSR
jgi:proteasome alpha subunit